MPYPVRIFQCKHCGIDVRKRCPPQQIFCGRACSSTSRKTSKTRHCQICNSPFEYNQSASKEARGGGKYCSANCRFIGVRNTRNCPTCGKEFYGLLARTYCSRACGEIGRRNGKNVPCGYCGETLYLPKSRLKNASHYFCSLTHQIKWQARNKTANTCKICGDPFKRSASHSAIYCSLKCRDKDPERLIMLHEMNRKQQHVKINKLEKIGYSILDRIGIPYEKQWMIANKFCVDAFVPSANLIIQFDGDYWHGNPAKFEILDPRQQKRVHIDKSQNAYFAKCGYGVLRFWEVDIHKRPDWIKSQLEHAIQSPDA